MKIQPTFPNMLPDERVVLMLHRHGFVAVRIALLYFMLALVPVAAWLLLGTRTDIFVDVTSAGYAVATMLLSAYALVWGLLFFVSWLNYYLDVWIITNERIINITQQRLFHRIVSEQKLYRVQDVTWQIEGVLGNLFKFGNVTIQTAGEQGKFTFEHIPDPESVAKSVMHLLEQIENQMGASTMAKMDGDLLEGSATPNVKPRPEPPSTPPAGAVPPSVKL
ncbi:MAG: PH domain-containing protein [Patescibacteria group bacterium]